MLNCPSEFIAVDEQSNHGVMHLMREKQIVFHANRLILSCECQMLAQSLEYLLCHGMLLCINNRRYAPQLSV